MDKRIGELDFIEVADYLNCDVPAMKAVFKVESSGSGFLDTGDVKILFEGHIFHRYTNGIFSKAHPTISYPKWTKQYYCKGRTATDRGLCELARQAEAYDLDSKAALLSASYGCFQIMGFNYKACGFDTVESFVDAMNVSEKEHLLAFGLFIIKRGLDDELRDHDWIGFASGYNGKEFAKNQYDKKLAAAWRESGGA